MTFRSKNIEYCVACGRQEKINHFDWTSLITNSYLGIICEKCAVKEVWGNKFRTNKRYQEWQEKRK